MIFIKSNFEDIKKINKKVLEELNMKNTDAMVIDTLKEVGALLAGHFLLSSGRHSNRYCQCAQLL